MNIDQLSRTLCQGFVSFTFFIGAWLRNMLPDSTFRHLDLATWSVCFIHFLISIFVLLLESERACMVSTLMLHELESVEKPSATTIFVTLFWFIATFELFCSF